MKMKNNLILVIIIIIGATLFFGGCSSNIGGGNNKDNGFIGIGKSSNSGGSSSTQGIVIKFDKNYPPSEMLETQPYTFALSIDNYLNEPVNDLVIKPIGFDRTLVKGFNEEYSKTNIPARTKEGFGYSQLVISGIKSVDLSRDYNFNPTFEYAYTATTDYIKQICVPDTMNKCNVKVENYLSQTGPLVVKVIRISSLNGKIRIDFSVVNAGTGSVVNSDDKFKTGNYVTKFNLNEVKLGTDDGTCFNIDGTKNYQLLNQKGNFYCEFTRSSDASYASQLVVKLSYAYNNKVSKNIVIKDMNSQY